MELGCGSDMTCWRRLHAWQQGNIWERLYGVLLDRLGSANAIHWERAAADSASAPAKKGRGDRGEPGGPRPTWFQAPHPRGRQRHPARLDDLAGQPARRQGSEGSGRYRAGEPPVRWPTAAAPRPAARRQGLRFHPLPTGVAPTRHYSTYCPARHREQQTLGPAPLGGRAHAGLVRPLPPHRRQPHLLALRPEMVLLSALIPRSTSEVALTLSRMRSAPFSFDLDADRLICGMPAS